MALNEVYDYGDQFGIAVTEPDTPESGDPVLVGQLPGVALIDEQPDGLTTIKTNGVYTFAVKGHDGTANAAIAAGDIVYYDTGANGPLNVNDTAGVRFGYALDAVASGATTTIRVKIGY
jgi:predicted RecA/RadA family phage recombinase